MFKDTFLSIIGKPIEENNNPSKIDRNPLRRNNGMQTLMKQTTDPEKKKDRSHKTKNVRWPGNKEIKT